MALFNLALRQSDDAAMKAAQQKILEIVKNPSDPDYVVTEVKRRLVGFAGKTVDEAAMREARTMLDEAIKVRPTFADLYVLRGQLALSVWKDVDAALKDFDEALTRGQANVNAVALQVRLLAERGRYAEARKRMERVPSPMWNSLLDRIAAEVLDQTGESERAVAEAERLADAKPQDGSVQIWCGELAMRNKDYKVAQRTFQRAVDLNPSLPDSWMRLVALYLQERRSDDVERTVREAHLAIDEEYLPLLTAYYYELYGRWREAEDVFQSAFGDREDGFALQHLAEFYLKWSTSNPDYVGKASVYVNRILRASYDKKLPADDPSVAWARRQAARILSLRGEYRESLKAEKLLAPDGTPATTEDAQQLIDVLERRGDPASRLREIELLKKLQTTTALSVQHEELLGRALFDVAEYDAARAQMEDAIGRHPRSLALRAAYIGMLTELKQLDAADRWLVRMNEVPDSQIASLELKLRLAGARGATQAIRQQLEAMTPNLQVLTPKELEKVRAVAVFAEQLGDFEYALKMMHEYVRRAPEKTAELARMVSLHGDVDEAIALLKQLYPDDRENVTMMAVAMARARYAEEPKKVEEELGRLVQSSLRDDPESARFGVLHAEMLEINGKIPESIAAYQQALAMADMPPMIRATAGNNLAYLLALSKQQPQEALKIIDDSMSVLGPISDILDTRGLVYLSMGEPAKAVQDFQNCVRKDATPSKRFHLVRALLAAGEIEAAKTAWKQALDAGLTKDKVAKLELEEFDAVTAKVKSLGVAPPKTASQ